MMPKRKGGKRENQKDRSCVKEPLPSPETRRRLQLRSVSTGIIECRGQDGNPNYLRLCHGRAPQNPIPDTGSEAPQSREKLKFGTGSVRLGVSAPGLCSLTIRIPPHTPATSRPEARRSRWSDRRPDTSSKMHLLRRCCADGYQSVCQVFYARSSSVFVSRDGRHFWV